jgi:hypothetical protein
MLPIRCTNCGLINIPERQTCKRCQAPLQRPLPQDSAQVTSPDQSLTDAQAQSPSGLWHRFAFAQTITSPLPFTLAHQRLATLLEMADAGHLQRSGFSFQGQGNGDTFRLYGPHGNRSWPLITRGNLVAAPDGTQLAVTIRPSWLYPIGVSVVFGWWLWGALTVLHGGLVLLPLVGLVVVVVMLLSSVKSEGQIIIDMLADALSVEPVFPLGGEQES